MEENDKPFRDCDFDLSSDSESDGDEMNMNLEKYQKECRRQDNIMPNGRLSEAFEEINCELMKRVDSNASNYQPSPKTTHRLLSTHGSKTHSQTSL